jgi:ketosteroid isomerase-like protein
MPDLEIKALQRIYEALSRWDIEEVARDVTHDFELILPETVPWGGTRHGREGFLSYTTVFRDHVDGQWADPDDFIDGGDVIVVFGRMRGRATATGKEYEVPFAHAWTLTDGMPSRCRSYFDSAPIMAALARTASPD